MESSDANSGEQLTPGARLRQAREAAGISPREMADRLNWLPAHVAAIEENRFESLRGTAFVRGYLRAYARAVGLDEDELVAQYAAIVPEDKAESGREVSSSPTAVQAQKTGWSVALGTVIAVVIIAGIWWQQRQAPSPSQPATASAPARPAEQRDATPRAEEVVAVEEAPAVDAAPVEAPSAAAVPVDTAAVDTAAVDTAAVDTAAVEVAAEDTAVEETASAETAVAVIAPVEAPGTVLAVQPAESGAGALSSGADAVLEFSFSGDCWLEVRDGDGQLIYADLRSAGDRLALDGKPPFQVLAGNAAAVTLSFRGEPVPVRTRPGRETARFTVGEP